MVPPTPKTMDYLPKEEWGSGMYPVIMVLGPLVFG